MNGKSGDTESDDLACVKLNESKRGWTAGSPEASKMKHKVEYREKVMSVVQFKRRFVDEQE